MKTVRSSGGKDALPTTVSFVSIQPSKSCRRSKRDAYAYIPGSRVGCEFLTLDREPTITTWSYFYIQPVQRNNLLLFYYWKSPKYCYRLVLFEPDSTRPTARLGKRMSVTQGESLDLRSTSAQQLCRVSLLKSKETTR